LGFIPQEQEIALGCRHLIQNVIVLWNYLFISDMLSKTGNIENYESILNTLSKSSIDLAAYRFT